MYQKKLTRHCKRLRVGSGVQVRVWVGVVCKFGYGWEWCASSGMGGSGVQVRVWVGPDGLQAPRFRILLSRQSAWPCPEVFQRNLRVVQPGGIAMSCLWRRDRPERMRVWRM